jgi:hypothetical protein
MVLKGGYFADVVVFYPATIAEKAKPVAPGAVQGGSDLD